MNSVVYSGTAHMQINELKSFYFNYEFMPENRYASEMMISTVHIRPQENIS